MTKLEMQIELRIAELKDGQEYCLKNIKESPVLTADAVIRDGYYLEKVANQIRGLEIVLKEYRSKQNA